MTSTNVTRLLMLIALSTGCGGGSSTPSTTQTVSAATGATLTVGGATLTIPSGALDHDTSVTLRQVDPKHPGRLTRVEVEPHDALVMGHEALLATRVGEENVKVLIHHGVDDSLADVEVEDRNHHEFKTHLSTLGDIEVEVGHGSPCAVGCSAGQECVDGACEDHDHAALTCGAVCSTGQECDDAVCKTHDQYESDHHGTPGMCSPPCAPGLTCHDGICSAHH
jgi:hypothetical protein